MKCLWLLITLLAYVYTFPDKTSSEEEDATVPIVNTLLGSIKGNTLSTLHGKRIYSFKGIKYAQPPVGNKRFKAPEPIIEKWKETFDATHDMKLCPQPYANQTYYSEDCLTLNVFTTKLPDKPESNSKRPVVVYFHGGGFLKTLPCTSLAGPQYLLDEEIVLVIPNYRLGALGFISTGDKEAPGNNGLKDQVMALHWVQENIESFGGDPRSVTIMGYSAGAFSVSLHLLSPLSKGLFHRAIMMSGSAYGQIPVPHGQLNLAKKLAKLVGCPDDNSKNITTCLKSITAKEIVDTHDSFLEFGQDPIAIWLPVVEPEGTIKPFLTKHPLDSLHHAEIENVPVLVGRNEFEFASLAYSVIAKDELLQKMNNEFNDVGPIAFLYNREKSEEISKELKTFYFGEKPLDKTTVSSLEHLYSDAIIGFATHRAAKLLSAHNKSPVYYYNFDYKGRFSYFYLPGTEKKPYGPVHLDELIYLFYNPEIHTMFEESDPETKIVKRMTKLWGNFIKTGQPIPEVTEDLENIKWEPYKVENKKYMQIGEKLVPSEGLYEKRYEEWEKLFP